MFGAINGNAYEKKCRVSSRLCVVPILYALRLGLRTSIVPAINLTQVSEYRAEAGVLQNIGGYEFIFMAAAGAYAVALLFIHLLSPKLETVEL